MGLVGWLVLAAVPGFAVVMNGILDIHSIAVPEGRPVVQVCGLCSNSAPVLCVETAWPVLFLPGQSCAGGIPMYPEKQTLLRDVCHLSPDTL